MVTTMRQALEIYGDWFKNSSYFRKEDLDPVAVFSVLMVMWGQEAAAPEIQERWLLDSLTGARKAYATAVAKEHLFDKCRASMTLLIIQVGQNGFKFLKTLDGRLEPTEDIAVIYNDLMSRITK